ncbi:MAG: AAA family ATPase [Succinivibrionaceae bacterium]|nr:AAA family ATPase [Succinivibrionaceae bacterium]
MTECYLRSFRLPTEQDELYWLGTRRRACYTGVYPSRIFSRIEPGEFNFAPVTIFYGGNGSGKTTLLNPIAEMLGSIMHSTFNSSAFFGEFLDRCRAECTRAPVSHILTSDDVFDYMLNVRYINEGIDARREDLFKEWRKRRKGKEGVPKLADLAEYEQWKENYDVMTKTQSRIVRDG